MVSSGDPHRPEDPVLEIVNWSNAIRNHEVTQHRLFTAVRSTATRRHKYDDVPH